MFFEEREYSSLVNEPHLFRAHLDNFISHHGELIPKALHENGYILHDKRHSVKQGLTYRRIRINSKTADYGQVLTIMPSFIMPYWVCRTEIAEKVLELRYKGQAYESICKVLGGSERKWERMETHLGRFNVVTTSLIEAKILPKHLVSDEKISFFNGQELYIAMTSAQECVLGISASLKEDEAGLTAAYGNFATEVRQLDPHFEPKSVVVDGWAATSKAWQSLFPSINLILCFLHGVLKIGNCAKNLKEQWGQIKQMLWDAYRKESKQDFLQALDEFKQKADDLISPFNKISILNAIEKMWSKKELYAKAFDTEGCYRTSNQVDRPMNALDKYLFNTQYFHGHLKSAELKLRAWALIHNFKPFCKRTN